MYPVGIWALVPSGRRWPGVQGMSVPDETVLVELGEFLLSPAPLGHRYQY